MNSDDSVSLGLEPEPRASGRLARVLAARRRLPENVRVLSSVSLANDSASELAYPVVPLFLTITLGAPVYLVGLIEGIAEATAQVVRLFSGWLSDRQGGRRKPWIWAGYGVAEVARAIVAAAPAWGWVLTGRVVDRLGKGARSSPRDALIRDSTPAPLMGAAFGYHRAMDTVGAVIGPLVAVVLLVLGLSLREILWFAILPGAATLLLLRRLKEAPAQSPHAAPAAPLTAGRVATLPASFWTVLGIWVVFSLGNSSDTFLLLRSHNLGLNSQLAVLAYAVYNMVSATLAWPFGHLSDRIPRGWLLGLGTRRLRARLPRVRAGVGVLGGVAAVRVLRGLRVCDRRRGACVGLRPRPLGVRRNRVRRLLCSDGGRGPGREPCRRSPVDLREPRGAVRARCLRRSCRDGSARRVRRRRRLFEGLGSAPCRTS